VQGRYAGKRHAAHLPPPIAHHEAEASHAPSSSPHHSTYLRTAPTHRNTTTIPSRASHTVIPAAHSTTNASSRRCVHRATRGRQAHTEAPKLSYGLKPIRTSRELDSARRDGSKGICDLDACCVTQYSYLLFQAPDRRLVIHISAPSGDKKLTRARSYRWVLGIEHVKQSRAVCCVPIAVRATPSVPETKPK
jgi:hypothetical protein